MCGDCWFAGAVTPGYKIHSAGNAVSTGHKTDGVNFVPGRDKTATADSVLGGYKNHSAGEAVSGGHKTDDGNLVSTGYKTVAVGGDANSVSTGYKIRSAGEVVSGGHKTGSANFVPTGDKPDDGNLVSTGYKTDAAGGDANSVSTGYKIRSAGEVVSGGHKTAAAAMTASAKYMDACAGAAWMLFAVTARNGMAWTVVGRGTFAVTGCFLLLPFGMRCAGCGYVVMNSFFACRDDFIFSQFVISFLPLKEPLRVRGDFSLLEVL